MVRPFRRQIDDGILDCAAALFARHGFAQTSLQAVADAVGISKAGLLHHFPSKDALHEAVLRRGEVLEREVVDQVAGLPQGPERDRHVLEALIDDALAHPGLIAFILTTSSAPESDVLSLTGDNAHIAVFEAFGTGLDADPERIVRIIGAMGALSVLVMVAHRAGRVAAWRTHVIDTCLDALGHRRA